MIKRARLPLALTIAGSDSGGGAGIQVDLKTFAALGVHGTSAVTCLTAQNPRRVFGIQPATPRMLAQQIEAVLAEFPPTACKTGMLFSADLIQVVAKFFCQDERPTLVVDPVMVATSGARLLKPDGLRALKEELLPLASLVTPNLGEAELLTGFSLRQEEDLRRAAHSLHERFGCAALVKGGHLRAGKEAVDIFYDGRTELLLSAPFIPGISTHGTGCIYSAAIAGYCARGLALPAAVERAKDFVTQAIAQSCQAGRHDVLNPFWKRQSS